MRTKRTVSKIEGCEIIPPREFCSCRPPVKTPGDHKMQDEPDTRIELDNDSFPDSAQQADGAPIDDLDWRLYGSQQEWTGEPHSSSRWPAECAL